MQLLFHPGQKFEEDLCRLDDIEREEVVDRINYVCSGAACGNQDICSLVTSPGELKLGDGCCSSLSILPAGRESAVILAVDEDPIFEQVIVSLIRVVRRDDAESAYRECACKIHRINQEDIPPGEGR